MQGRLSRQLTDWLLRTAYLSTFGGYYRAFACECHLVASGRVEGSSGKSCALLCGERLYASARPGADK